MSSANTTASISTGAQIALIAYCYVLPVICVIGIIGNITNLITLASPRLRAVSYMYLRALAVADLCCMVFVLVFVSVELLKRAGVNANAYEYAVYQAHFMLSLINWALGTGVYVVLALSLERFISIVFPIHFRKWNSPARAWRAICVAYTLPAIMYVPYALWRHEVIEERSTSSDGTIIVGYRAVDGDQHYGTVTWQLYEWTREALLRFAPIVILCALNVQIIVAFRRRQNMFARLTNRKPSGRGGGASGGTSTVIVESSRRDDTLLFILAGIVVMFFICNIPAAINLLFINETVKKRSDYQIFRAVANLLEITNHAAQFYVFCACSSDYRSTFLEKFPCVTSAYRKADRMRSFSRSIMQQKMVVTNQPMPGSAIVAAKVPDEPVTIDVHLASGEEDVLSGESSSGAECRSLLKHDQQLEQPPPVRLVVDLNGTTYL